MGTVINSLAVPIILDQAVGYRFHFYISLLFIVPIILDQDVGYCSHYFGSGCWLLLLLFWTRLLVTVPIILGQAVG
jgi:hypothetical protein